MMTVYRKNLLRIGIGAALLLCYVYLKYTGAMDRTPQDAWDRWRAACAVPSLVTGIYLLFTGAVNLACTRRRRLGTWALSQMEGPNVELLLFLYWVLLVLSVLLQGFTWGKSWIFTLLWSAPSSVILIVICCVLWIRHSRPWDSLAHHTFCEDCGYILDGIEGDRCPECGRLLAERAEPAPFGSNILLR